MQTLLVEEPHDRLIAAFDLVVFADVTVKGFSCPKSPIGLLWLIDQLCQFIGLLAIDDSRSTRPLFDDQPIDTGLIETVYPLSECSISN